MPLYDYRCASCGDFREFAPMAESRRPRECPNCRAPAERLLATPFLAGRDAGSGTTPRGHGVFGSRHVCGHGCAHAHGD
jgi:putative FmdB family regulatory protein